MNRRSFLAASSSASLLAAAAPAPKLFEIEKLHDGVWAAISNPMVIGNSNSAIFELSDSLLIVDTQARPGASAQLMTEVRKITKKPVQFVVLTHIHGDHVQGMGTYLKMSPRPTIIAHAATRKRMAEGGNLLPTILGGAEKNLAAAQDALAKAANQAEKDFHTRSVAERKAFLAEMKTAIVEPAPADITRDFVIHDKLHDLHVMFRGTGHTDGDLCVFCPQKKVIATGDFCVSTTPFMGLWQYHWPRSLNGFATECDFETVIPGHGAVQKGRQRFTQFATYLEDLMNTVQIRRGRGNKTAADLKKEITPETLVSLKNGYAEYLGEQIFKYRLQPPSITTPAQAFHAAFQGNIDQVYNVLGQL